VVILQQTQVVAVAVLVPQEQIVLLPELLVLAVRAQLQLFQVPLLLMPVAVVVPPMVELLVAAVPVAAVPEYPPIPEMGQVELLTREAEAADLMERVVLLEQAAQVL